MARRDFLARLHGCRSALNDPALQHQPASVGNRDSSQLLRNGLAVVVFALLEDFIRRRTQELLAELPGKRPYGDLTDSLREASSSGAFLAAPGQARRISNWGGNSRSFLVSVARDIASTGSSRPVLSPMSLGFRGSNLGQDEVPGILKALKVDKSWPCLDNIARRAGSGGIPLKDAFREIAQRRHQAAHQGAASVPLQDLISSADQVLAIALAFDAACSTAVRRFLAFEEGATGPAHVILTFIQSPTKFQREAVDEAGNVLARSARAASLSDLLSPLQISPGFAVFLDRQRLPRAWQVV
jgi:hypothetical protein